MIKLLIGGSPCTYWSIAQKNNRETEPSGMGWELFKNYLIAKEKFNPDFFLYENNKSADEAIKRQIREELNVWDGTFLMEDTGVRYIEINSALVSAQNRQRFYVHNCGEVGQPDDRGILLKDILESGIVEKDKGYCLKHQAGNARDYFKKTHTNIKFEPVIFQYLHGDNPGYVKYDKAPTMTANACYQENNKIIEAVRIPEYGKNEKARALTAGYANKGCGEGTLLDKAFPENPNKQKVDFIAEPVPANDIIGTYPSEAKNKESKQYRIYDVDGKSTTLCGEGGGMGAKTGLYAMSVCYGVDAVEFDESGKPTKARSYADGKIYAVYEVRDGLITIKDKQCPIKLKDGYYIIRKLTVTECCRLQTMPDDYCRAVINAQAYRGLGNGWTAEVIIHILSHALKDIPRDERIVVLSMYDGIGTGRYVLDKMGFTNIEYHAYEIDKYAIKIAMSNYPDIIQHGDAYQVRDKEWRI